MKLLNLFVTILTQSNHFFQLMTGGCKRLDNFSGIYDEGYIYVFLYFRVNEMKLIIRGGGNAP